MEPKSISAGARRAQTLNFVLRMLEIHPKRSKLIKAGKQRDDLLRALVPLFLMLPTKPQPSFEVTSGVISMFWKLHGVKIEGPRAARALRVHVGYARNTRHGKVLTPNGVKYVKALAFGK